MVQKVTESSLSDLVRLAHSLWPRACSEELEEEFREFLQDAQCALFLYLRNDKAIGFAQCQLRQDYVEGTETSPVGYLEGIYIEPEYRGQGYARELLQACECWAKEQGCTEFASDCELTNIQSLKFHLKLGFREANRIICFTKIL